MANPVSAMDSTEYNCQLCSNPDSEDNMVACDLCEKWFHYMCAGVDSFIKEKDFVCVACAGASNLPKGHSTPTLSHTSTKTSQPTTASNSSTQLLPCMGVTQPSTTNMYVEQAGPTKPFSIVSSANSNSSNNV